MGMFADFGTQVGSVIGAAKAKKYSKKAMKAQVAAADKGIGEINNQWGFTQGQYQPWVTAGTGALGAYGNLVGLGGGEQQQMAIDQLKASPYYQSLYRNGEEAILQNASALGGGGSGLRGSDTARSLADFGADTLSQTIQQQLSNLGVPLQYGAQANNNLVNAGIGKASDIGNLYLGQGQAQAADYMRRAAATNAMWQGIGGAVGGLGDMAAAGFGAPGAGFDFGAAFGQGAGTMGGIGIPGGGIGGGLPGYMSGAPNAGLTASTGINATYGQH